MSAEFLEYQPEHEADILARLPEAFAVLQDSDAIIAGNHPRPGLQRKHVFDFANGIRLIASLDTRGDGDLTPGEHLSFSYSPAFKGIWTRGEFVAWIRAFCERTGWRSAPNVTHQTPKGVLHLFFEGDRRRFL